MIHPCGMKEIKVTSMSEILKRRIGTDEIRKKVLAHFNRIFDLSNSEIDMTSRPYWLKKRLIANEGVFETKRALEKAQIATVCESSLCPNTNECFSNKRATFLILGKSCTRSCGFCSVEKAKPPEKVDAGEAEKISDVVERLNLKYVIITSVTRDDLDDGGASQFVNVINRVRILKRDINIEVLIPDFEGRPGPLKKIVSRRPDVLGHNIETVKRLYPIARRGSDYSRSLELLRLAKTLDKKLLTKSGIMLGLGEREEEIVDTIRDIRNTGSDILTIGQYLRPGPKNLLVKKFYRPEEFEHFKKTALDIGFRHVASGPFVRSSYFGEEIYKTILEVDDET